MPADSSDHCGVCNECPVGLDDICGIGVLAGYIGGTVIAIALLLANYLLTYNPRQGLAPTSAPNAVDERLLKWLRRGFWVKVPWLMPRSKGYRSLLNEALIQGNLNMCDLQIFTGLGILIAGFTSLPTLKGAHWQMICYLAWFATVTHISGLTIMSKYLHGRPLERRARVFLMTILLVVLLVAMVPMVAMTISEDTGGESAILKWNCNASCFFRRDFLAEHLRVIYLGFTWDDTDLPMQSAAQFGSVILAMVLLCFSFAVRVVRLSPNLLATAKNKKAASSGFCQGTLGRLSTKEFHAAWRAVLWQEALVRPLLCVFLQVRTWVVLWTSMAFEVIWVVFLALYGLSRVIQVSTELFTPRQASDNCSMGDRGLLHSYEVPTGDYHGGSWSFGQVLPVFLLCTPVWGVARSLLPGNTAVSSFISDASTPCSSMSLPTTHQTIGKVTPSRANDLLKGTECLKYLDKDAFVKSQLGTHAFIFSTLIVTAMMAWLLAVLLQDIGVGYSLSTIISTFPGSVLAGLLFASYLQLYISTIVFDMLSPHGRRRSISLWVTQALVDALMATVIGVTSSSVDSLNAALWHGDSVYRTNGSLEVDVLIMQALAPNFYIIFFMLVSAVVVVALVIVGQLCTCIASRKHRTVMTT